MARDRQRAKQRRRRQSGTSPEQRAARSRAREMGLDDPSVEESGLHGGTPTPNPLDHASADVDEAELAERGPVGFDDEEEDDLERAPDEVEGDLVRASAEAPVDPDVAEEQAIARRRGGRAPRRGRALTFLRNSWEELKRVQWPDRRHVGQATAVVLGFVVLAGGYLGLMDAIWKPLVNAIL
jgi:preprotein translocase subunit SecE